MSTRTEYAEASQVQVVMITNGTPEDPDGLALLVATENSSLVLSGGLVEFEAFVAQATEALAQARYTVALDSGLSMAEAQEEGWPTPVYQYRRRSAEYGPFPALFETPPIVELDHFVERRTVGPWERVGS